jgi:hypothetical protein
MSDRTVTTLAYAALAIFCACICVYASFLVMQAIPEMQALQTIQANNSRGSN